MISIEVPTESIKTMPWNPASRTEARALKDLAASIRLRGILVPVVLDEDYRLIDGHRRVACAKALGITTVPAVIVPVRGAAANSLYAEMIDTSRKVTGREATQMHLFGGIAPRRHRAALEFVERCLGRNGLVDIAAKKLSATSLLTEARAICRYTGTDPDNDAWMRQVLHWLIDGHRQAMAHGAIADRIPPKDLLRAIERGADIRRTWQLVAGDEVAP